MAAKKKTARKKTARKKTARRRPPRKQAVPLPTKEEIEKLEEVVHDFDEHRDEPPARAAEPVKLEKELASFHKKMKKGPLPMLDLQRKSIEELQALAALEKVEDWGSLSK